MEEFLYGFRRRGEIKRILWRLESFFIYKYVILERSFLLKENIEKLGSFVSYEIDERSTTEKLNKELNISIPHL